MLDRAHLFGAELRRLRLAAGLTIERLATTIHYSKAQISKIETGRKQPTVEFARLCDTALAAEGALHELVAAPTADSSGDSERGPSRRQVMVVGAVSALGVQNLPVASPQPLSAAPSTQEVGVLEAARVMFDQFRLLGQVTPARYVLPGLDQQTQALTGLARTSSPRTARKLLELAARYAEFAGWMAQEAGDVAQAAQWTQTAVDFAEFTGDSPLPHYAQVRRGLLAYYSGDAARTVELAGSAQSDRLPPRIRGLAAQRQAQGHALAGEHAACMKSLDRARHHFASDALIERDPALGPTNLHDPAAMVAAWCLLDLGRPRQAALALDTECARIPEGAIRTQARYGARRALAHAMAGDIDQACALTHALLGPLSCVSSATIQLDVRRLNRTLMRYRSKESVRQLLPGLAAAMHSNTV
ncbi:helix-turn-helix transcriptional regulator [Streptomyces sp. NA04227]|uniref:helix-turn-helix domain-containing protein n=1 Tax=Streptomyces sp. NA04227 TaxID=2742136 RepID=UPI0020CA88FF|nr:helix-turn-helix transcriptional regulator [Streptomyces sp. NA04227]